MSQNSSDLLDWAERWHWPQLVLFAGKQSLHIIRAGSANWTRFVVFADDESQAQAWARIEEWRDRAGESERVG